MDEKVTPEVPSDIVELVIAVDLNPKDPEEPINVNDVKVKNKGEGGEDDGEDWKDLTMKLLKADPAAEVDSDDLSYEEAKEAVDRVTGDQREPEEEEDPFDKAMKPKDKPKPEPKGRPSDSPFGGAPKSGGVKEAIGNLMGKPKKDEEEEEGF